MIIPMNLKLAMIIPLHLEKQWRVPIEFIDRYKSYVQYG